MQQKNTVFPLKNVASLATYPHLKKQSASPQKTEFISTVQQRRINELKDLPSLKLNDSEIKRVPKVKPLGIIVDEELIWND